MKINIKRHTKIQQLRKTHNLYLYSKGNKVYYKGMKSNGMINILNIEKISLAVKDQLSPLYKALGVNM